MLDPKNVTPVYVFFAVAVAEVVVTLLWLPAYYRTGIPIYSSRLHGDRATLSKASNYEGCEWRTISADESLFRTKQWAWLHYTPVLHGYVEQVGSDLLIHGYLNWWVLAFLVLPLFYGRGRGDIMFVVFSLLVAGLCYFAQYVRLTGLAKYVGAV